MSSYYATAETIVALATPPGRGGIGIIRVSGERVAAIARAVLGSVPEPRQAVFRLFRDAAGGAIDQGVALYFPAPASFTGEDVLELQGHGGPVVMDSLLRRVLELGARPARPGEFSERAFVNGKLDLAQAEAIADLIDSASEQAARSAMRSLQGEFSSLINALVEEVTQLRAYVEAGIDFVEEELDLLADGQVARQIEGLQQQISSIQAQARQGYLLREGIHIVIIGTPNVGKSSLLNCLAGRETAIVTAIAGTTRDLVRDSIHLDGLPLHITDTAGLRETDDPVEQEGIRRAREALQHADAVLLMQDDRDPQPPDPAIRAVIPPQCACIIIRNKCDLSGQPAGFGADGALRLSAKTGNGVDALKQALKQHIGYHSSETGTLMARRRHLQALRQAGDSLALAFTQAQARRGELVAEELRQTQNALGEITGQVSSEDLLGRIFSTFCIGK
jgi:tRNA modification GTPase